jgi:ABC-type oligopeptide transport system substrate-binding subunit
MGSGNPQHVRRLTEVGAGLSLAPNGLGCSRPDDPARTTNAGAYCNKTFDRLVTQAETLQLTDPAAAQNIWASADHLAVDQAAWVPLANTGDADLLSRRAGHFTLNVNGFPQIDQLWVRCGQ